MSLVSSDDGEYRRYLFEYRFANSEWGIQIAAKSPDEARERLKALSWAQYKGEVQAVIPVPGAGLITRLTALFRR